MSERETETREGASAGAKSESKSKGPARSKYRNPSVTIFGAGITGLTVAHELAERGFRVHVIEKAASEDAEYGCEVGGLARTQMRRVPHHVADLVEHFQDALKLSGDLPPLVKEELERIRPGQVRFPLPQRLIFQGDDLKAIAEAKKSRRKGRSSPSPEEDHGSPRWLKTDDWFKRTNKEKLDAVFAKIREAYRTYRDDLEERLERMGVKDHFDPDTEIECSKIADNAEKARGRPRTMKNCDRAEAICVKRAESRFHSELILKVLILAYTDDSQAGSESRATAWEVAKEVERYLWTENDKLKGDRIPNFEAILQPRGMASAQSNGISPPDYLKDQHAWVQFRIVEDLLPGEHGYRYFPAFYRNLFDTMQRTAIVDTRGYVTTETAYDRLVPAPNVALAFNDAPGRGGAGAGYLKEFPRRRAQTLQDLREIIDLTFRDMGVTERDLLHYEMELLRYATSCTARRVGYEQVSWWDFVRGRNGKSQPMIDDDDDEDPRNRVYSGRMRRFLREIPQALAAMEASETDARTHGTITLQLLYDDLAAGERTDKTLNGPASTVWLNEWKRYLKRQGVDFYKAALEKITADEHRCEECGRREVVPELFMPPQSKGKEKARDDDQAPVLKRQEDGPKGSGKTHCLSIHPEPAEDGVSPPAYLGQKRRSPYPSSHDPAESDFFVLAVPLTEAVRLVTQLGPKVGHEGLEGDFAKLSRFAYESGLVQDAKGEPAFRLLSPVEHSSVLRGDTGRPNFPSRYPLRDLAGIQYFFPTNSRIGTGHVYYVDAEWGLSSISQISYWRDRPRATSAFLGQISVDIGDWYAPFMTQKGAAYACKSSADEIANFAWDQICASVSRHERGSLRRPAFYHLDSGIQAPGDTKFIANESPFLINIPGHWSSRPGLYTQPKRRFDPAVTWRTSLEQPAEDDPSWQRRQLLLHSEKEEIRYGVAYDRWVLAGTYMATYTRLNTMEAANESARHAVNTILHALALAPDRRAPDAEDRGSGEDPAPQPYACRDCGPLYNSSGVLLGQNCTIWNPEEEEWRDLEPLKRLDEALYEENLPHFLDILRVPSWLGRVPHRKRDGKRPLYSLMRLFDLARSNSAKEWGTAMEGLDTMGEDLEKRLRDLAKQYGLDRYGPGGSR